MGCQGVGLDPLSFLLSFSLALSLSLLNGQLNGQKQFCLVLSGPSHELFFAFGHLETDTTPEVELDISKKSTSTGAAFWNVVRALHLRHVSI